LIHHIIFKEKKINPSMHFAVKEGCYGLDVCPHKFYACREEFAITWNENTTGFFFTHLADKGYSIATFLKKIEIVLKQSKFSQYAMTNRDTILWIEPSMFWKECRMKRSLLTILIRAGMIYDPMKDNFEEAIFSEKFIKSTRLAVMRFLYGFTKYIGPTIEDQAIEIYGWKYIFESHNEEYVKNCLVSSDEKYVPSARIADIWA